MSWKHIVLEAYCTYAIDEKKVKEVPKCCEFGPGSVGVQCLKFEEGKYCPFFAFGKAPATVIVTNEAGEDFKCDQFFTDLNVSEKDWNEKQNRWINKWAMKIISDKEVCNIKNDFTVWIEAEEWENGQLDELNDNTDVIVEFENGSRWVATVFTYENISKLAKKNKETGECMNGKYFWATDMLLVDKLSKRRIYEVIKHLIKTGEFKSVFNYCGNSE